MSQGNPGLRVSPRRPALARSSPTLLRPWLKQAVRLSSTRPRRSRPCRPTAGSVPPPLLLPPSSTSSSSRAPSATSSPADLRALALLPSRNSRSTRSSTPTSRRVRPARPPPPPHRDDADPALSRSQVRPSTARTPEYRQHDADAWPACSPPLAQGPRARL